MRITKIHLQNIGVFEDTTIEFPEKKDPDKAEIHILTGENGTGKSTLLYAISSINSLPNKVYPYLLNRFRERNPEAIILVELNDTCQINFFFDKNSRLQRNDSERTIFNYWDQTSSFPHATFDFAFFAYSGYRKVENFQIKAIREVESNPMEDALNFNNSVNPALLIQWVANNKTKEALELLKNGTGNPMRYRKSINRIEQVIAEIIGKPVEFVMETEPLNVSFKLDNQTLSFDVRPDGLKSIISWIADLLMRLDRLKWSNDIDVLDRNFIVFLDEIDIHLHPAWQRKVLPVIQKLFRNAQIFVSTHSPFVVGSVDGAWIHKLVLKDSNSQAEPPRLSEDGESYQLILREVFDIDKRFGVGTEADLDQFNEQKKAILQRQTVDKAAFLELAKSLAVQSIELETIIGSELRQLSRLTQEEYII